jgi:hypothetical protein
MSGSGRPGRLLEAPGNRRPRGMAVTRRHVTACALQNPAYRPADMRGGPVGRPPGPRQFFGGDFGVTQLRYRAFSAWWVRFASNALRSRSRIWFRIAKAALHSLPFVLKRLQVWAPTSLGPHKSGPPQVWAPLPWGRTENVARHAFTYSIVKQPTALSEIAHSQKKIAPCSHALGQRVARIPVSSLPLRRGGRRADRAHCPDCSGRKLMVHLRCTHALRRANAASWPLCL